MWERLEKREITRHDLRPGPGERPRPDLPAGDDLIPQIKHIVVLMMENHSYDNYLGTLAGRGEGLPKAPDGSPLAVNFLPNGTRVPAHHLSSTVQVAHNPTQRWHARHISCGRPLVLLVPGAYVPEPPVPDRRDRERTDRRPAVGPDRLPAGRHDLRRARHARHLVGQLPQRTAGRDLAHAAVRHVRADRASAAEPARTMAARRGQSGLRQ